MSKSKPTKAEIHAQALTTFDEIQTALHDERTQCLQDRRFYSIAGAQWEGALSDQFANKPRFEVNKIHLAIIRIINEYRNNRISVDFVPKEGKNADQLADTCDQLYRADEQDSSSEEAYDNAFEEAVAGGFGAWRLRAEAENPDEDEDRAETDPPPKQRIRIEPIFDADSTVFFDLNAKKQDKSDATKCFVLTAMTPSAFEERFDTAAPSCMSKEISQSEFDWFTPDVVYIAEYYVVEKKAQTIRVFKDNSGVLTEYGEDELDEETEALLVATGEVEQPTKTRKTRRVCKYVLSGSEILEGPTVIAGKYIPIVPVYGKRWYIDGVERCMGHVRLAKDTQRLKNMQLSKLGELSALSSMEKPIVTPEQIAGHQLMWTEDNVKNYPYLLINPLTDANGQQQAAGPVAYTHAPAIPPAMGALLQITEQDIQDILGNQQAGEQLHPNMSGMAVELVQNKLDMQTFIYMSNMSKAIRRGGEIWLSMARDIFVEEGRKLKGLDRQGASKTVELFKPIIDKESGLLDYENDLSRANFDVAVEVGPSSDTKRSATVKALTGMMTITQDPETIQVLGAMAMMNMEGEGIQEARDYFRKKLVRMGVIKPTDEEAQELAQEAQQAQPDPQAQYLQAAAAQAQAAAQKAQADTMLAAAKTEETKARTIETLAGIDRDDRDQATKGILEASKVLISREPPHPKNNLGYRSANSGEENAWERQTTENLRRRMTP